MLRNTIYQTQRRATSSTAYAAPSYSLSSQRLRFAPPDIDCAQKAFRPSKNKSISAFFVSSFQQNSGSYVATSEPLRGQRFFAHAPAVGHAESRLRPKRQEEATSTPDSTPRARHLNEQTQLPRVSRRPPSFGRAHVQREGP